MMPRTLLWGLGLLAALAGSEARAGEPSPLAKLEVSPERRLLPSDAPEQQLAVRAHFKSGEVRDVTELAVFTSSDTDAASVTRGGLVRFKQTAEVSVLVRYLNQF